MSADNPNSVTTRLLTLLNVSATKVGSRNPAFDLSEPSHKLNRRKSLNYAAELDTGKESPTAFEETTNKSVVEAVGGEEIENNESMFFF
jgi:U3 small nucleolar RNA-associated protein 25